MNSVQMTVNDLLRETAQAEQRGVKVDWKTTTYTIVTMYNNYEVVREQEEAKSQEAAEGAES